MSHTRSRSVLLALILFLFGSAHVAAAQTPADALRWTRSMPATGAAMTGMAGAATAGAGDLHALLANPAGLGYYANSEVVGSLHTLNTSEDALYGTGQFENDIRNTGLFSLGYAFKAPTRRGSLVLGAAIAQTQSFDRLRSFEAGDVETTAGEVFYRDFADSAWLQDQTGSILEEGSTYTLSFGGGVEAIENTMLGVSVNIPFGTYNVRDELVETYDVAGVGDPEALSYYESVETLDTELVGINAKFGLSSRVSSGLRVGVQLETPTVYAISEEFSTRFRAEFADGVVDAEDDPGNFEYGVMTPWRLAAGGSFEIAGFTVSADAEFVDWSQMEFISEGFDMVAEDREYLTEQNLRIQEELDAVLNTRVGLSYQLGRFIVRTGWATQPDPVKLDFVTSSGDETDAARSYYSAGFGIELADQMQLDFGWMQTEYDDLYQPYSSTEGDGPFLDEEVTMNRYTIGLSYRF